MKKIVKYLLVIGFICVIILGMIGLSIYNKAFTNNISPQVEGHALFIPTGSDFNDVKRIMQEAGILLSFEDFIWVAEIKNYDKFVKSGKYIIKKGLNNNQLVNLLRSGNQTPVKVVVNSVRTKQDLALMVSAQLEFDSVSLSQLLNNEEMSKRYGFSTDDFMCMFIPNTYEFYWDTSAEEFLNRMHKEYESFWDNGRKGKLKELGLRQHEVSILASIVQAEQSKHNDEKPIIAGLYLNRLRKKMRLESDPTLVFALGDFTRKRILNKDKNIDSPYNTYKNSGLPPGPINLPEISSIDAVLNFDDNNYLFMCAKEDFSGYHNFAKTNRQHNIYAQRYRRALNKRRIYK